MEREKEEEKGRNWDGKSVQGNRISKKAGDRGRERADTVEVMKSTSRDFLPKGAQVC